VVDFKIVGPVFLTQYTLLHQGSTLTKNEVEVSGLEAWFNA